MNSNGSKRPTPEFWRMMSGINQSTSSRVCFGVCARVTGNTEVAPVAPLTDLFFLAPHEIQPDSRSQRLEKSAKLDA